MSTAAAAEAPAPAKGKKKLMIIVAAALVVVLGGGGAAMMMMKKKAADAEEGAEGEGAKKPAVVKAAPKFDPKAAPTFVPLDAFTVNLADREAERYAQIGISLELVDAKTGEKIKLFMPAIRNNILMVLAHKRSSDLLERAGKEKLADEVLRETERALGLEPLSPGAAAHKGETEARPVRAVHFSNFIIQ